MVKSWLSRIRDGRGWGKRAFVLPILVIGIIGISIIPLTTVQAQPPSLGSGAGLGNNYSSGVSTCAIETVGWVICPVMRSIAKLADYGFAFINQDFLMIEYDYFGRDGGVYIAWEIIRNVANALFVLVFLYIVYTQLTGRNTGNFNLKRILPRLIIGVILVNVSYYLCMAGIQLSNIIGSIVTTIMGGVAERIGTPAMSLDNAASGFEDGILIDITSAVLTKTGTVWILLAPVAAITISIATICAVGLVLLIMRKVIVSMLVLISPLLFLAYLLPNLERHFQQWRSIFIQLLLLYPIIAFLLGTGQIISATIINVGSSGEANYRVRDDGYQSKSGGSGSATTDLAAAGAAVLPLLGTWFALKGVMSVAGNVSGRIAGRGGRQESKAKVEDKTGKPKLAPPPQSKLMGQGFDRKPAFSRLRRRKSSTPGGALPVAPSGSKSGVKKTAGDLNRPQVDPLSNTAAAADALNDTVNGINPEQAAEQALKDAKLNDATSAANSSAADGAVDTNAAIQAQLSTSNGAKQKDDKPWEKLRQQKNTGGGSGNGSANTNSTPSAPVVSGGSFQSPSTSPQSSKTAPAAQPTVIAVPVQVDGAALLSGKDPVQRYSPDAAGLQPLTQPPQSGTQEKAKARAQKYIFDAASSLEETQKELDRLLEDKDKVTKELDKKDADTKKDS